MDGNTPHRRIFVGVSTCNCSAACGRARVQVAVPAGSQLDGVEEVVSVVSQARTSFIPSLSDRASVTI